MMQDLLATIYGAETRVGHGLPASLKWLKVANQNNERIRPRH